MTAFSQRDPRWASDPLGTSNYTLAQAGCLLCAVASMLCDFGVPTDPHRLNLWLRDHNGYERGCLFRFYAVTGLGADLQQLIRPPATPTPARIADALAHGAAVLAEIIPKPVKPDVRHWIRILAPIPSPATAGEGANWWIMDPWQLPGFEALILTAAYPQASLRSAAIYQRNSSGVITFPRGCTGEGPDGGHGPTPKVLGQHVCPYGPMPRGK